MRSNYVLMLAGSLMMIAGADQPPPRSAADVLKPFQGNWAIESIETAGIVDHQAIRDARYVIKDGTYALQHAGRTIEQGTICPDVDGRTRSIDIVQAGATEHAQGIYEFRDGRLRLCFSMPGEPRPDAFRAGNGVTFCVLKRTASR